MKEVSSFLIRHESVQPSSFCKPHIQATIRVIIFKQKRKGAQFSNLRIIQKTDFCEHCISETMKVRNLKQKLKFTAMLFSRPYQVFVVIDRSQRAGFLHKLTWKYTYNLSKFCEHNTSKTVKAINLEQILKAVNILEVVPNKCEIDRQHWVSLRLIQMDAKIYIFFHFFLVTGHLRAFMMPKSITFICII